MLHRRFLGQVALALSVAVALSSVALADPPQAKPSAKPSAKTRAKGKGAGNSAIESAKTLMASGKRDNVEAGIQSLGLLGTPDAVQPLAERIRQGLPPDLLEAAIVTLMALGQPSAGPVLYELAAHRRADVRLRAIEAISATNPSGAEKALSVALSDTDARVRSAAATGLGEIGAKSSLERLFQALDRGNMEASTALGKSVPAKEVPRLFQYLGKWPFRSLGPAFAQLLQRSDVPDNVKLQIVSRLEEIGTAEVKGYLGDQIVASGDAMPNGLRAAILRAMQEIPD